MKKFIFGKVNHISQDKMRMVASEGLVYIDERRIDARCSQQSSLSSRKVRFQRNAVESLMQGFLPLVDLNPDNVLASFSFYRRDDARFHQSSEIIEWG